MKQCFHYFETFNISVLAMASRMVITTHESRSPLPCDFAARSISRAMLVAGSETPTSSASFMARGKILIHIVGGKMG